MSELPRLIGVCGLMRAGKTATAKYLQDRYAYAWVKFADPLKTMLRSIGLTDRHIEGDLKGEPCDLLCGRSPRYAMQTLGTEWGRNLIGQELWPNLLGRTAGKLLDEGRRVVVDDVRFPNEVDLIRRMGGQVWMVQRDGCPEPDHASEMLNLADDELDAVLENNGSFNDLFTEVDKLLDV